MTIVTDKIINQFREDGYTVIPGFLNASEIQTLKDATSNLVSKYCREMPTSVFSAKSGSKTADDTRDIYFAESGDKIRGFFEEAAVDEQGNVIFAEREKALNKIGHALHKFEPPFEKLTFSDKVKEVTKKLTEISRPTVIQSMVIFKHPKIGGEVKAHQDASYLYTEPTAGSLIGFWIALDDANLENGCLHFIPGSQKIGTVSQRFVRNSGGSEKLFLLTGSPAIAPQDQLKAAPVKAGDLVLIDGLVIHQSESNNSDKPRLAYTFHIVDGTASYSKENWLQPTSANTFVEFQN